MGAEEQTAAQKQTILELVDRLIGAMGEEKVRTLIPLLHQVVDAFDLIQQEV